NGVFIGGNTNTDTEEFYVVNCSITAFAGTGILVQRQSGTGRLTYFHLVNNTIATLNPAPSGTEIGISFPTASADYASDVHILGNHISDVGKGIYLNGGTRYEIHANIFNRITSGSARAVDTAGSASGVHVGHNEYSGVTHLVNFGVVSAIVD